MNAKSLLLLALVSTGCISETAKAVIGGDTGTDGGMTDGGTSDGGTSDGGTEDGGDTDGGDTDTDTDLDNDYITDADDSIVPYGDYVYVDQGLAASLVNTYLVGYGLGGSENEYDWCSENLPIERYGVQGDWPQSLQNNMVRFFFPDTIDIFFGNLRTFQSGECNISTDGGFDEWGNLTALNGVDEAICPNPLDGNRLGMYLMKDDAGVFAPGCQGFGLDPDEGRDSDTAGTSDGGSSDGGSDDGDGGDTDTDDCAGDCDDDGDGDGYTEEQGDCNDGWAGTNPGHDDEWADGMDNDCDGEVDEGCEEDDTSNEYCD